jgi:hypothetical protein
MKIKTSFLVLIFFLLFGVSALNAQTNLSGRYIYKANKSNNSASFSLTFEGQNSVYYSYFYNGSGTIGGKWTLEDRIIKIVLTRGESNWKFKLKQKGDNLEIAENLPEMSLPDVPDFKTILPIGTVFKKEVNQPTGPDLKPEEIGKRVLKLVKSIRTLEDISPKNIKNQTGVKVTFNRQEPNKYGFGGKVIGDSDWYYGVYAYPYPSENNQTTDTLWFSFDYQLHEPLNPDTAVICKAFDFISLSEELQQAGFSSPKPYFSKSNRISGWTFVRGNVSLLVGVIGGWEPNIDNCVKSIRISFSDDFPPTTSSSFSKIEFDPQSLSYRGQNAYQDLLKTHIFTFARQGVAAADYHSTVSLVELLKEKHADKALRSVAAKANPEGQVYALIGLQIIKSESFQHHLENFKMSLKEKEIDNINSEDSGCDSQAISLKKDEVIKKLESGEYAQYFVNRFKE